jgi:hypothetical protein
MKLSVHLEKLPDGLQFANVPGDVVCNVTLVESGKGAPRVVDYLEVVSKERPRRWQPYPDHSSRKIGLNSACPRTANQDDSGILH